MDANPYESPQAPAPDQKLLATFYSLRGIIGLLVIALIVQWCCHLLTALAMFGWMGMVPGAPTAKTIDSIFYGFACVGFTGVMALIVGRIGVRALRERLGDKR